MEALEHDLPLGERSEFPEAYAPHVLRGVPRGPRVAQGATWIGTDTWSCFELSCLEPGTRIPRFHRAVLSYTALSPRIVESKSLKLYLGSFHAEEFDLPELFGAICADVERVVGARVEIGPLGSSWADPMLWGSTCDLEDVSVGVPAGLERDEALAELEALPLRSEHVRRAAYTWSAFRSLCPVTRQPDFAQVHIDVWDTEIDPAGLLRYLACYRNHAEFQEGCVERIASELADQIAPSEIRVTAEFERRGGIGIRPQRGLVLGGRRGS